MIRTQRALDGAYGAPRAAALSGVPVSTVYYWARNGVVVPSVSQTKEKLWSYADLMGLRIVYWLRHPKEAVGETFEPSPMKEVKRALSRLGELRLDIWEGSDSIDSPLLVDRAGKIFITVANEVSDSFGQQLLSTGLDLLGPFTNGSFRGPDLRRPKPHLRIVPGKCSGEPHLSESRVTTLTIAALADRGFAAADIARLYPSEDPTALREAVDLERELAANLSTAA